MFGQYTLPSRDGRNYTRSKQKLYHRKSKSGCARCRARRIKCDELKPTCQHCARHKSECLYGRNVEQTLVNRRSNPAATVISPSTTGGQQLGQCELLESRERRLLEMRLMLRYAAVTEDTLFIDDKIQPPPGFLSQLALNSDAFLYSCISVAALHSSLTCKESVQSAADMHRHTQYLNMAIHEHNEDVKAFDVENIDALTWTTTNLRMCAIAALQGRPRKPYSPPLEWLTSSTAGVIYRHGCNLTGHKNETLRRMFQASASVRDEMREVEIPHADNLDHLLEHRVNSDVAKELCDDETWETYETTLKYIAGAWASRHEHQPQHGALRKLVIFPMMSQRRFFDLVKARRPRALVVLAPYFALLDVYGKGFWWVGDGAADQVDAIADELVGSPWHSMLRQPLECIRKAKHGQHDESEHVL